MQSPYDDLVVLRSLRLPEAQLRRIAQALVAKMQEDVPSTPRAPRYPYRVRGGVEFILNPDGAGTLRYRVDAIDLSATGVGLMHGNFVYRGTECELHLVTCDREMVRVSGKVSRCDCFCAPVHILGVHFHAPIDVGNFVDQQLTAARETDKSSGSDSQIPNVPVGANPAALRGALHELGLLIFEGTSLHLLRKRYEQICRSLGGGGSTTSQRRSTGQSRGF